jgi:nucleoid-associated protein YgaU
MTLSARISATTATLGVTGALLLLVGPPPAALVDALSAAARDPSTAIETAGADQVLAWLAAGSAWLVLVWVAGALALTVLGTVPGAVGRLATAVARLVVPGALRRLLAASLGLGLVAGVGAVSGGTPASAAPPPAPTVAVDLDWPAGQVRGGASEPVAVDGTARRRLPDSRTGSQPGTPTLPLGDTRAPVQASVAPAADARHSGTGTADDGCHGARHDDANRGRVGSTRDSGIHGGRDGGARDGNADGGRHGTGGCGAPDDEADATTGRLGGSTDGRPSNAHLVSAERQVTVRPGDSLWSIAAGELGPGARAGDIAVAWPRWWAANRALVGADPNLIHPGQRLRAPGTDDVTGRTP